MQYSILLSTDFFVFIKSVFYVYCKLPQAFEHRLSKLKQDNRTHQGADTELEIKCHFLAEIIFVMGTQVANGGHSNPVKKQLSLSVLVLHLLICITLISGGHILSLGFQ